MEFCPIMCHYHVIVFSMQVIWSHDAWYKMRILDTRSPDHVLLLFFHQCGSAPQRPAVRHQRQQGRFRAECCGGNPGGFQGIRSGWRYLQGTCKPASLAYIPGIASHFDTCCLADTSDHSVLLIYYFLWSCGLKGIWNVMTFCSLLVRLYVFTKYN